MTEQAIYEAVKAGGSCSIEMFPLHQRRALSRIQDEVLDKFFGCGSPIPPAIEGCTVLNLGCGTGRDVYLASQLVGPEGYVVGIDMTNEQFELYVASQLPDPGCRLFNAEGDEEQLAVAQRHIRSHMDRFGFGRPNVDFRQGVPEDLSQCGIADDSVDLVISNCGLNLSPDKELLFREVFRALKPGGEFYFANIFSDRPVPPELRNDPEFYAECYGGALTLEEFGRLLKRAGLIDYRVVSASPLEPSNPVSAAKGREIDFYSMKMRLFKVSTLEDASRDHGQFVVYLGTIPELPDRFVLDQDHLFVTGEPVCVCGNTAAILGGTRYARHFRVCGDHSLHHSPFASSGPDRRSGNQDITAVPGEYQGAPIPAAQKDQILQRRNCHEQRGKRVWLQDGKKGDAQSIAGSRGGPCCGGNTRSCQC